MIRRFTAVLALAIAAGSVPAIAAHAVEPPPVVDPVGRIEGTVTDAQSGAPIAGACVELFFDTHYTATGRACTGADGSYALSGVWATGNGSAQLLVTATGYPQRWWPDRLDRVYKGVTLVANETWRADFALSTAAGTIAGQITGETGEPLPRAQISLYRVGEAERMATITAGVDGRYERTGVPPGDYHFAVHDRFGLMWYPRQFDREKAATVTVAAGGTRRLDDRIFDGRWPAFTDLRGRVTDSAGAPVAGATVTVDGEPGIWGERRTYAQVSTNDNGEYVVPKLRYTQLYQVSARHGTRTMWYPQSLTPARWTVEPGKAMDIVLPVQLGTINGTLSDFDGTAMPSSLVTLHKIGVSTSFARVPMKLDGTFEIPNVPTGEYRVQFGMGGRGTFPHTALIPSAPTTITVGPGQTVTLDVTSMRPSYVELTARDGETREPIAGLCLSAASPSALSCTGRDGVALVGPYWVAPTTTAVTVGMGSNPYYFYSAREVPIRQGETTVTEATYRRGATLEIPIAGGTAPATGQICVHFVSLPFDIASFSACGVPEQGVLRLGPYESQTGKLFLDPADDASGAQWLGSDGGKGRQKDAMTFALERHRVTVTPAVRFEPAGSITGTVTPQEGGTAQVGGCAYAGRIGQCGSYGTYAIHGLGPYDWEVRYTMQGRATAWSGGAPDRNHAGTVKVLAGQSTTADISLRPEGRLVFSGAIEGYFDAFDARTGDKLGMFSQELAELNNGPIVLRFTAQGQSCWMTRRFLERPYYYFQARAGQAITIDAKPQPGVNCVTTEPKLINTVTQPTRHAALRHLPLGRLVQQELLRLFP